MKSFGLTDKGKVRSDNQDCFIIEKCRTADCVIMTLCDGMGGAKAGGVASRLSARAFVDFLYKKMDDGIGKKPDYRGLLQDAINEANGVSFEYSHFDEAYSGMGTTLVGGIVYHSGKVKLANVGDSRAYLVCKHRKAISQITHDHSMVEELVACGVLTREQAHTHPQKNVITRALGTDAAVECDYFELELGHGDILLLCSDGLSNIMSDDEILNFASENPDPEFLCRTLMNTALNRGAPDNVTIAALVR